MPEGVSDNIDFRFLSIGNGEPVKFVNRGRGGGRNIFTCQKDSFCSRI